MPGINHRNCCCDPCGSCYDSYPASWTATWADTEFDTTTCQVIGGTGACSGIGGTPKSLLTTVPPLGTYDVPYTDTLGGLRRYFLNIGGVLTTWCTAGTCSTGTTVARLHFNLFITLNNACRVTADILADFTNPDFNIPGYPTGGTNIFDQGQTVASPCGGSPIVLTNFFTAYDATTRGKNGTITLTPNF